MTTPSISFSGIASGLDTDSIITQLMAAERIPLDQLEAQKQGYVDKDEVWQTVSTRLSALRTALNAVSTRSDFSRFATAASSSEAVTATVTGAAEPTSLTFTVDRLAAAHVLALQTTFSGPDAKTGPGTFTVTVDGEDFVVNLSPEMTIAELAGEINSLGAGVSATVVATGTDEYRLMLTGVSEEAALGFTTTSSRNLLTNTDIVQQGQDARITIGSGADALEIVRPTNTFTDVVPGVSIELLSDPGTPVTVSVGRDADATVEAVTTLVNELNAVLEVLHTETAYNAELQSGGKLGGDSTARTVMSRLQTAVAGAVLEGADLAVASGFGLSITRQGSYTLDQDKLRDALAADFDGVSAFFEDALGAALDEALEYAEGADGAIARTRDRWKAQIEEANRRIAEFEDRLDRREAALVKEFAAMESLLAGLQSQSAWLTSQLGGLTGGTP
jgi:flagellar hook-associated protein 2